MEATEEKKTIKVSELPEGQEVVTEQLNGANKVQIRIGEAVISGSMDNLTTSVVIMVEDEFLEVPLMEEPPDFDSLKDLIDQIARSVKINGVEETIEIYGRIADEASEALMEDVREKFLDKRPEE